MEINIISDNNNATLNRRDVSISVNSKTTPSRADIKNKLAAMLNSKPELIVVNKLNTEFGKQETIGTVGIYENEEVLKKVALGHLVGRDKMPEPEEEAEAAPKDEAAPVEDKSAEESKPEATEESK